jgi:hypothetical protein
MGGRADFNSSDGGIWGIGFAVIFVGVNTLSYGGKC